jgi:TolB protein
MTKISLLALLVFLSICIACQPEKPATSPATTVPPPTSTVTSLSATATVPPPTETVASLSATPTITPTANQASESSLTGWLAFYSDRDGNPEIYVMNADGSGVARLTNDPTFDDSPALSPDSRQIAFLTARHDPNPQFPDLKYELYVMDIDGSNLRRLTTTEAAEDHPAWSPDGNWISFDADYDGDGSYEIYQIQPDGSNLTRLTSGAYNDQFADWAPDGKQIAFASDRNGNWDLFVMDADGSNQQAITSSPNWELFPAWSPDGSRIAFNGLVPRSRNTDIFLVNADGSDTLQLTNSPGFDENPAWSPDGSQIAFQTQQSNNFELYVMYPDGSGQRPLSAHPANELWPSWASSTPSLFEKSSPDLGLREAFQVVLGDLDRYDDLDVIVGRFRGGTEIWFIQMRRM